MFAQRLRFALKKIQPPKFSSPLQTEYSDRLSFPPAANQETQITSGALADFCPVLTYPKYDHPWLPRQQICFLNTLHFIKLPTLGLCSNSFKEQWAMERKHSPRCPSLPVSAFRVLLADLEQSFTVCRVTAV